MHALGDETLVSGEHGLVEIGVLHVATIDEEVVGAAFLTGTLGFADKARDTAHGRTHLDGQQLLGVWLAKHIGDALQQGACLEVEHLDTVVMEGEVDMGID